jgi:hypothetical protein
MDRDLGGESEVLQQAGIVVSESRELCIVLREYPEMVKLLVDAAALIRQRFPMARLLLRWYVDPEVSGDEYPVLVVRLPSYDDDQGVDELIETIWDANQVLDASPAWVLVLTDFEVARDGEKRSDA